MAYNKYELWAEIVNDPEAYGYATLVTAEDWQGIADLLNDLTVTHKRKNIALQEVVDVVGKDATNLAFLTALNIQKETRFWKMIDGLASGALEINGKLARIIEDIIPAGALRDDLTALADEDISRATELGWPVVPVGDVMQAINWGGGA